MNVVITGASKGIGRAVAEIFAANGNDVLMCSRGEPALYKALEEILTRYPNISAKAKPFDLSKKEEAISFANWALSFGPIDILVNNAGLFEPGEVHNEADGVLESQMATNLYSAYHVTRTILPSMMQRKSGHIFNLCSIASLDAYKNGGAYSISKFAMHGFNKNLREEMKPFGIKVTAIFPGAVLTESWSGFDNTEQRIMEARDIAEMIYSSSKLSAAACVEEIIIRPSLGDL